MQTGGARRDVSFGWLASWSNNRVPSSTRSQCFRLQAEAGIFAAWTSGLYLVVLRVVLSDLPYLTSSKRARGATLKAFVHRGALGSKQHAVWLWCTSRIPQASRFA